MNLRNRWLWLVAGALAIGIGIYYLAQRFPEALSDEFGRMRLVHGLLWLALIGSSFILHRRLKPQKVVRDVAIWIALAAVLFVGFAYRHEFSAMKDRVVAEILPHSGTSADDAISFQKGAHGHFVVEAEVDGIPVRFLVDTGASDVVLSPADAQRLGLDLGGLAYTRRYRTANGIVAGAPIRLGQVRLGPIVIDDVRASVNGAEMRRSLLGMSFLDRLSGYEIANDTLILRP
jgi:aspartyl protease family protein